MLNPNATYMSSILTIIALMQGRQVTTALFKLFSRTTWTDVVTAHFCRFSTNSAIDFACLRRQACTCRTNGAILLCCFSISSSVIF